jgi:PAS domain S-box-containing protein
LWNLLFTTVVFYCFPSFGAERMSNVEFLDDHLPASEFEAFLSTHQAVLEAMPMAVCVCASDGRIVRFNARAVTLWGRTPHPAEQERFCGSFRLYAADGAPLPHAEGPMAAVLRSGEPLQDREMVVERCDGSRAVVLANFEPLKSRAGRVQGAIAFLQDITERRAAEEQRAQLVAELSHRVKNTLATVISIGRQSFANPDTAEARRAFDARIRALAQTHTRLAESNWAGASLEVMLLDELAPYRQLRGQNLSLKGPDVTLGPKCALTLGMAFHELAMNAGKYGALSTKEGRLDIAWDVDRENRMLTLSWIESGGPLVGEPARRGFGRMLVEKVLAADLRGNVQLKFERPGLSCSVAIPLDRHLVVMPPEP